MLDGSVPPDGFGDVRCGKYKGGLVAVKTERVAGWHRYQKIRGVSTDVIFAPHGVN